MFLLESSLEVDLGFVPESEFRARGPKFRLVFGSESAEDAPAPDADARSTVGMGWHHLLHARAAIDRTKPWQAEYMITGARNHTVTLACTRHGVEALYGRGADRLPPEDRARIAQGLVRALDPAELERARRVTAEAFLHEVAELDATLARRLAAVLREVA